MPAKKKTITLEQFYDRFVAFEKKVDDRFTRIDGQFHNVAGRFDELDNNLKGEVARLEIRIGVIEKNLEKFTGDFERLEQEYFAITETLKRIEAHLDTLTGNETELRSDVEVLTKRVARIEQHVFQGRE
jgi:chromosome segregation ATPase